jgi:hypothetical protein
MNIAPAPRLDPPTIGRDVFAGATAAQREGHA